MNKIELIKKANAIVLEMVTTQKQGEHLSENLLSILSAFERTGCNTEEVWLAIALANNWKDKKNKIEGAGDMPKTPANYRSMSRKAVTLGVGHQFATHADWKKAISDASKLANSQADETPQVERINLNELELPGWIERANAIRSGMTAENIAAFDKYIHHHIEAFMQKKAK